MAEKNVRIRLFKDNSRYKGDLFVSVNGVNYKIRRGVFPSRKDSLRPEGDGAASDRGRMTLGRPGHGTRPRKF